MKLIIGLGNPDKEYDQTRHNVGFMVIDNYLGNVDYQKKFNGLFYKTNINGEVVFFIKPTTYMNLSGLCVKEFVNYFNVSLEDILVIQDDLDLPVGDYKLKKRSSSGGHNGIKSIIKELGSDDFLRLKIGIYNDKKRDTIDFVLGKFSKDELDIFNKNSITFNKIIDSFINVGISKTMNIYNTKEE